MQMYCNMIFGGRAQEFIRRLTSFVIKKAEGRCVYWSFSIHSTYIPPCLGKQYYPKWGKSLTSPSARPNHCLGEMDSGLFQCSASRLKTIWKYTVLFLFFFSAILRWSLRITTCREGKITLSWSKIKLLTVDSETHLSYGKLEWGHCEIQ